MIYYLLYFFIKHNFPQLFIYFVPLRVDVLACSTVAGTQPLSYTLSCSSCNIYVYNIIIHYIIYYTICVSVYYVYYTYGMCILFSWHLAKNCCVVIMRSLFF